MSSKKLSLILGLGAVFATSVTVAGFSFSSFALPSDVQQQVVVTNHVTPGNDRFAPQLAVKLFSSKNPKNACWSTNVNFKQTEIFNAGSGMGCADIAKVTITPVNSEAYTGSKTITPPAGKYSTQVMVTQDPNNPPHFDSKTGNVTTPGQILATVQSGFSFK